VQALTINADGLVFQQRTLVGKLALERRLPLGVWSRESFDGGALMSYGPDQVAMCRRAPSFVDKILKGAKPGNLPVEQPTKLELFINLKVARILGLSVPPMLLALADEVIE
jgi:putative ABC transport system substrate-binding protein